MLSRIISSAMLSCVCGVAVCAQAEDAATTKPEAAPAVKPQAEPNTPNPEKAPALTPAPPRASLDAPPLKPRDILEGIPVGPLEDGIILVAGDIKVPFSAVERVENAYMTNEHKQQPRAQITPELQARLRKQFAFQFFVNALIERFADQNKLTISKEKFDEQFLQAKKEITGNNKISYEQALLDNGLVDEDLRNFKRASWAIEEKLSESITDADIHEAFVQAKENVPMRRTSHILFMYKGSTKSETIKPAVTRTKEEAKAAAEAMLKQVKEGKDFAELARQNSDCPSKFQGGDLDFSAFRGKRAMVEPFANVEYKLEKVGDISDVVETSFGFHIIKLTGIKNEEDFKPDIRKFLIRQKYNKQMEQLVEENVKNARFNEKMFKAAPEKDPQIAKKSPPPDAAPEKATK